MAIDPRQLKPGELARLLNSTPLGEVISERQLHRHRTRAGFRVAIVNASSSVNPAIFIKFSTPLCIRSADPASRVCPASTTRSSSVRSTAWSPSM